MPNKPKHTPPPYAVEPYQSDHGDSIAIVDDMSQVIALIPPPRQRKDDANAAFIVKACNSYEKMRAVLSEFVEDIRVIKGPGHDDSIELDDWPDLVETYKKARAVLKLC